MSRLKSKLDRRKKLREFQVEDVASKGEKKDEAKSEIIEQLRRRMEKISRRSAPTVGEPVDSGVVVKTDPDCHLPGAVRNTSAGEVWVNTVEFEPFHRHGAEPVADFLKAAKGLSVLGRDEKIAGLDPTKALFFDTETTGLSGGTGTLPFLLGMGWLDKDGSFTVEHLFCRNPGEEAAQLEMAAERLGTAEYLVSFNGKAFDMPLLNTRFIMNRMINPGHSLPHLDLLHVARRIFSRRLSDRSLASLERAVLGFEREGDIPGHAIPGVYADYLRGGSNELIKSVLDHNTLDLLALSALGGVLAKMYEDPGAVEHAADHLGLAKAAWLKGESDFAMEHLTLAGENAFGDHRLEALHMAARHAAKAKDFVRARDLWLMLLEQFPEDPYAHLALAKYFEHREKDYVKAIEHASASSLAEGDEGTAHRLARLERKMTRAEEND